MKSKKSIQEELEPCWYCEYSTGQICPACGDVIERDAE